MVKTNKQRRRNRRIVLGLLCVIASGLRYQLHGWAPLVAVLSAIGVGSLINAIRYTGAYEYYRQG